MTKPTRKLTSRGEPVPLTVAEVADELGISNAAVSKLIADKTLKAFNVGAASKKFWRVLPADLDAYKATLPAPTG